MLTAALVLFTACGVLFTAFPILYAWRTRRPPHWYDSTTGRWMFGLNVILALLVDLTLFTYWHGPWSAMPWVRLVLYAAFAVAGVVQLVILLRVTRRPRA